MKTYFKLIVSLTVIGIAFALTQSSQAGVVVTPMAPPGVVVAPVAVAPIPGSYIWDGTQFVGMVGNQYYFLAPGNVWRVMDPVRRQRFQTWERSHPNWRSHATRNTRFRNSGRPQSIRTSPPPPSSRSQGPNRGGNSGRGNSGRSGPPQ